MPVLDFGEIPSPANKSSAWDTFELFARDCLTAMGLAAVDGPDRGPDEGRDIVVKERRDGPVGRTVVRWLVSCKHKAHSGKAVSVSDEGSVRDRVEAHDCSGFIGFYSTLPSAALTKRLGTLKLERKFYDRESIESFLLTSPEGLVLARRYFPNSTERWMQENPRPADLLVGTAELRCANCGRNLLDPELTGNAVFWLDASHGKGVPPSVEDVYCCCKGRCDRQLEATRGREAWTYTWDDVSDIAVPTVFLKNLLMPLNQVGAGWRYSEKAAAGLKNLLWALFPRVSRQLTQAEQKRVQDLFSTPAWAGGLGGA